MAYLGTKPGNGQVTTTQIADANVTTAKIADNAITTAKIAAGAVIPADMANGGAEFGWRNRIINGDMRIDQRNAGASTSVATGDGSYCLDRWRLQRNGAGTMTVQQVSSAPTGFASAVRFTVTGTSTPGAGDYYTFGQVIEGFNSADLMWGTASAQAVTLSFWINSSVTGTYSASLYNFGGSNTYPATFTVNAANTWEFKTITIPGATAGTWATTNAGSIYFRIDLGSGSNYSTATANAWNTSGLFRTNSSINFISNASATLSITGVQLEAGSVATPFERRPYGTELMLCQRYCMAWSFSGSYTSVCPGQAYASNGVLGTLALPVTPRVVPTGIVATGTYSSITAAYGVGGAGTLAISAYSTPGLLGLQLTGSSGLVAGNASHIACVSTGTLYTTGSEL